MKRLAVVSTHPIQYYAPWFRYLAREPGLNLRVFYLWDFGVREQIDRGFEHSVRWDIPLLDGYAWEIVPNVARDPGTHHFWGINNPDLPRRVDSFRPDVVLCLGYNYASFLRLFMFSDLATPFLLRGDSHRLVRRTGVQAWSKALLLRILLRRFSAFLYVGKANRRYYLQHGIRESQLFFCPHCVDNERFMAASEAAHREAYQWKHELGIPFSYRVILFAGKFEPKKRPRDLLAAFRQARLDNVALLFVGSGSLETQLRQDALLARDVFFAPFQNQSQMPRTYAAANLLVLPSEGDGETWGLCVNEAMCLGKPVIVSDHVGCAEDLVKPGQTGLVFPAGVVDALAACLQQAFASPERLGRWGMESRRRVTAYGYQQATEGLRAALRHVTIHGENS